MKAFFAGKRVMVTGACGTVGRELTRQLLTHYKVGEMIALDNNESELFFLEQSLAEFKNAGYFLADIRDRDKISRKMRHINIVFHTAAFKHVILCERAPFEAAQTNIQGVQNIITGAFDNNIDTVIFTSSDKAVNPTSVMGTSKLMGERLMTAANNNYRGQGTKYTSTRFGNVLGSRGSVIPIFKEQIKRGGPVTLTDPEMTRFIMSIKEAVRLVIESAFLSCGGEVLITKMPVIRIIDLAEVMIDKLAPVYGHDPKDISINVIGSKPGEKLYEELMSDGETRRALELTGYFSVLPAFKSLYRDIEYDYSDIVSEQVGNPYHSGNEKCLTKEELSQFLLDNELIEDSYLVESHPAERFWPDKNISGS